MTSSARVWLKRLVFPGIDLHTRCRYRHLTKNFKAGDISTLDAGSGNGALSYAAYRKGNRVLGVQIHRPDVEKSREYFAWLGTDAARLRFAELNLYDLPKLDETFDQIVCCETLEHITHDARVVDHFFHAMREGGVLHVSVPNAAHPANQHGLVDAPETGWHVRDGYTPESLAALLEPAGFRIVKTGGYGSRFLVWLDERIRAVYNRFGAEAAMPVFLLAVPFQIFDRPDPRMPLSLYAQAVKDTSRRAQAGR